MRIIRFVSNDGKVHVGTEPDASGLSSEVTDVLDPQPTGKSLKVVKLLAPILPPSIYCIGLNYMKVSGLLINS